MGNSLKVSLIIPMYNTNKCIVRTLKSACNQNIDSYEIVLVNDGSTDDSLELSEDFLSKNAKCPYKIITQENGGLSFARNVGIRNSVGNYIAFLDSDDCIDPDFLLDNYNACEKNATDCAICQYQVVYDRDFNKPCSEKFPATTISKENLFDGFIYRRIKILVQTVMLKRQVLEENGLYFIDKIKFSEDSIFIYKLIFAFEKFSFVRTANYNYYQREGSMMRKTAVEYIYSAYPFYKSLEISEDNRRRLPVDLILPRWVLGILNVAARMCMYDDFVTVAKNLEYSKYIKVQFHFEDKRVRFLAMLLKINLYLYYAFINIQKKLQGLL